MFYFAASSKLQTRSNGLCDAPRADEGTRAFAASKQPSFGESPGRHPSSSTAAPLSVLYTFSFPWWPEESHFSLLLLVSEQLWGSRTWPPYKDEEPEDRMPSYVQPDTNMRENTAPPRHQVITMSHYYHLSVSRVSPLSPKQFAVAFYISQTPPLSFFFAYVPLLSQPTYWSTAPRHQKLLPPNSRKIPPAPLCLSPLLAFVADMRVTTATAAFPTQALSSPSPESVLAT